MNKAGGAAGFLWAGGGGYKRGVRIFLPTDMGFPSGTFMRLQAGPWGESSNFVRLEWNPATLGIKGLNYLQQLFNEFLPDWRERMLTDGHVTRVDIACDFIGVKLDDIIVWSKKIRTFGLYTNAKGESETLYLGRSDKNQLTVYDRRKRLKKANQKVGQLEKQPEPKKPLTRIEARRRVIRPIDTLGDLPNPFESVVVFQPDPEAFPASGYPYPAFLNHCQMRGYKRALKTLPKSLQGPYEKTLMASQAVWWSPEGTWTGWPELLKKVGLATKK